MNQVKLTREVRVRTGLRHVDVDAVLSAAQTVILETLQKGETVSFRPVGIFKPIYRPGRWSMNPKTRQKVWVPPHLVIRLKTKISQEDSHAYDRSES